MEKEDTREWVTIKNDLPDFDGTDPMGWLDQVEKFFDKHRVNFEQRVGMAFFSMKGPADYWFYCLQLQWPNMSWEKFQAELMKRFCQNWSSQICEAQFEQFRAESLGVQPIIQEKKNVQEDEAEEIEEEQKQWFRTEVELSKLDGIDPTGRLVRMEKKNFKPESKKEMGGPVIHWFQCLWLRWSNLSWKKFRIELMKRFCGHQSGNIYE